MKTAAAPVVVHRLLIPAWFTCTAELIYDDGIHYLSAAELIIAGDWTGA